MSQREAPSAVFLTPNRTGTSVVPMVVDHDLGRTSWLVSGPRARRSVE